MLEYTIENNKDLLTAYEKGKSMGSIKGKKYSFKEYKYNLNDNPFKNTGNFGKKLSAAWHKGFREVRAH